MRQKDVGLFKTAGTLRGTTLKGLFVAGTYRGIRILAVKHGAEPLLRIITKSLLGTDDPITVAVYSSRVIQYSCVILRFLGRRIRHSRSLAQTPCGVK